jgi:hypothetical protein
VTIKASPLAQISPSKTLLYQLVISAPFFVLGFRGPWRRRSPGLDSHLCLNSGRDRYLSGEPEIGTIRIVTILKVFARLFRSKNNLLPYLSKNPRQQENQLNKGLIARLPKVS